MQGVQFVALDCETTGLDPEKDSVIELGAVKFSLSQNQASFDSLFDPGVRIPSFVARLTGITDAELQTAPKIAERISDFQDFCEGCVLIGHNITFDLSFLAAAGLDLRDRPNFDTFELASLLLLRGESLSLEHLAQQYGVLHSEAHRALSDAEATRDIFRVLVDLSVSQPSQLWEKISRLKLDQRSFLLRFAELILGSADFRFPAQFATEAHRSRPTIIPELRNVLVSHTAGLIEIVATPEQVVASVDSPAMIFLSSGLLASRVAENFPSAATLFSSEKYVCHEKLEQFLTRELSPVEASLSAKLILHPDNHCHELILSRAEALLFPWVAATPDCTHAACQLSLARKNSATAKWLLSDHSSLLAVSQLPHRRVVCDALELPSNLKQHQSFVLDLPSLESLVPRQMGKLAMWWGMLGLLFREAAPQWGRLQLSPAMGLAHYNQALEAGKSFVTAAEEDLPPTVISALRDFLSESPDFARWIRSNAQNEITLELVSLKWPALDLVETVLLDVALDAQDDFAFAKKTLHLPTNYPTVTITHPQATQLLVGENLPSIPQELTRFLLQLVTELSGVTAVLFGNAKEVGDFYERAVSEFDFPVFGRKLPAAQKIAALPKALIISSVFGRQVLPAVQNLILVKLPFWVKDNADWNTETLPAAVLAFKKLYLKFCSHPSAERFITLDARLTEKAYGASFLQAIPIQAEKRNPQDLWL